MDFEKLNILSLKKRITKPKVKHNLNLIVRIKSSFERTIRTSRFTRATTTYKAARA